LQLPSAIELQPEEEEKLNRKERKKEIEHPG
jgi:hypothetical protein